MTRGNVLALALEFGTNLLDPLAGRYNEVVNEYIGLLKTAVSLLDLGYHHPNKMVTRLLCQNLLLDLIHWHHIKLSNERRFSIERDIYRRNKTAQDIRWFLQYLEIDLLHHITCRGNPLPLWNHACV